ncbi:hypothetical protein F383_29183 [Gossypium arboreum]|uniref:Uncharacterized protein n=1 Tax=Gossypium arboreum TaxID=29729 RepID=A0A0B0PE89_GOSAR|nr:hypothetical protein F383_29183 [Gossypium arboreum]
MTHSYFIFIKKTQTQDTYHTCNFGSIATHKEHDFDLLKT